MTQIIKLLVEDMHCPSCPKLIELSLKEAEGVKVIKASLKTKIVMVEYDSSCVSPDDLVEIIKESGYSAQIIN
jgi:copper chaperone CopZ